MTRVVRSSEVETLRDHEARIRSLERAPHGGSGAQRTAWGRIFNDGTILDPGSGDWSAEVVEDTLTISFTTPWLTPPTVVATCNDNSSPYAPGATVPPSPPDGSATVGMLRADDYDLSTVVLVSYDMDGNPNNGVFGYSFIAVGT